MSGPDLLALLVSLVVCFAVAGIGGYATVRSLREWYPSLRKPSWTPPNGIFGPVWTLLYLLMAIAAWLVWRARDAQDVTGPLALFAIQLVLNLAWSLVFFGGRALRAGFVAIVALVVAILATLVSFSHVDPVAALLLAPYLAWVAFATLLNGAIVRENARP